ncbi:hypothetical protein AVEN_231410-1, partial [Araneus ventricosus]
YKESSKFDEPRFRNNAAFSVIVVQVRIKSGLEIRADHTALSALRSLKPRSRLPKSVLHGSSRSDSNTPLFVPPQGMELRLPLTPLDNRATND